MRGSRWTVERDADRPFERRKLVGCLTEEIHPRVQAGCSVADEARLGCVVVAAGVREKRVGEDRVASSARDLVKVAERLAQHFVEELIVTKALRMARKHARRRLVRTAGEDRAAA